MENFISFDLENWYDSEFVDPEERKNKKDFVIEGLNKIVSLLKKHKTKTTFFVTGKILEKYPEAIKRLHEEGHEIASHNYEHIMLNKLNKKDFENGMNISRELIKKITGEYPKGFRAPSWSISKREFWVYDILKKLGFKYSSSLFPLNMGLYGSSKFPTSPFNPISENNIIEVPIRPFEIIKIRIPFSGGIYFRLLPRRIIKFFIKKINKKNKRVVLYLHPWEFCPDIPKARTNLIGRIQIYWGLKKNIDKLDYIFSNFQFCPLGRILEKSMKQEYNNINKELKTDYKSKNYGEG